MDVQFHESTAVEFPSKCACCLQATSDTRLSYRHTIDVGLLGSKAKTKKLPVPYCKFCRDHVDWTEGGGWFGLLLSIPVNALLWGGMVAILTIMWQIGSIWADDHKTFSSGVGIAITVAIVGFLTWRRLSKRPPSQVVGRHARRGESFEIISYKGKGTLKARIHNPQWAEMLLEKNPGLVRVG